MTIGQINVWTAAISMRHSIQWIRCIESSTCFSGVCRSIWTHACLRNKENLKNQRKRTSREHYISRTCGGATSYSVGCDFLHFCSQTDIGSWERVFIVGMRCFGFTEVKVGFSYIYVGLYALILHWQVNVALRCDLYLALTITCDGLTDRIMLC